MSKLSFCGHDCTRCVTYIATQNDDDSLRVRSQKFYKEEFGIDIPLSEFNCSGCKSDNVFKLCHGCPFRKCCQDKNIEACYKCREYPCESLKDYQDKYVNNAIRYNANKHRTVEYRRCGGLLKDLFRFLI